MARFKIIVGGQSRLYDILDDSLTAGSAASNAIRIEQPDVADVHVMVWRTDDGVWVSPIAAAPLRVNGASATRHRLCHGDRVELGADCALEFVDLTARPAPISRPPTVNSTPVASANSPPSPRRDQPVTGGRLVVPSTKREASDRRSGREQREGARRKRESPQGPRWHLFTGLLLLAAAVVWIAIRLLSNSDGVKSADDLFALAETQLVRGNPEQALRTAQTAAERVDANDDLRRRIAVFAASIKATSLVAADASVLDLARQGLENLRVFERSYLAASPTLRPACREFVRAADTWRERYAAICERYPESAHMVQEAATLRARYAAAAQLDQPSDVEDVLFAARRATRLKRPRYRDAIATLDEFSARGGDPAVVERVRAYRAELVKSGRTWFDQELRQLKREWDRGRREAVLSEVDSLLADSVLDEWRAELESLVKRWKQESGR